ncbi:xlnA, partial [Symbiodinium natans]
MATARRDQLDCFRSATCTAAATYSNPVEHVISVPGAVTITSVSEGTCMSIHRIIPWNLKVRDARQNRRCMDARTDNTNVYTQSCHDGRNQLWYMLDGNIMSLFDRKCLDYHTDTRNVYMHECHGGANQKWYFEEGTARIRSEVDHKCLDLNIGDAFNIYMYDCHDEKNQQFDREERSNSAFTIALHLDCSESEFEEITVEPVNWQKFQLRNSPNTLPGDFRWKNDVKKIQNVHTGKCLEAKTLGRVEEVGAFRSSFTRVKQVISSMRKTSSEIRYHCSHVSSLGMCTEHYSTQVETISPELETIKALTMLGATCPPSEGLKSLEFEASDKGKWIRFKYVCCQISRLPVSIYPPLGNGDKRSFEEDMAQGWEGVYCPVAPDDSGRMAFLQTRSFRPGLRLLFNLQMFVYDRHLGKWCVHGRSCVDSDVVHPLDTSLHNDEWSVIPVSDFDAVFEAKGAKPLAAKKKRKPPPLIKFGASDPEYLPECK